MIQTAPSAARYLSSAILAVVSLSSSFMAQADDMYIYKDKGGQVLLTNVSPSGDFDKFTKKVKVTSYKSTKIYDANPHNSTDYGRSSASKSSRRNAYDGYIRASAQRHNVDPALMKAMMHTESAFNPNARSPVGAQGLMQLMPATARRFKVRNPWSPAENIEGSAKYIAWLMRRFDNKIEYAIAGYNAGEGNVDKYGGIPPFKETRHYVKKVMSRYHSLYKNDTNLLGVSINSTDQADRAMQKVSYGSSHNGNSASYSNSAYAALR